MFYVFTLCCVLQVPEETPVYMVVSSMEDLLEHMQIEICCEGEIICTSHSFPEAFRTFLAIHYIFNIEYGKRVSKTLMFFEKCMLGIENTSAKRTYEKTVINLIGKLVEARESVLNSEI